jgi:hypothetical protein
VMASDQMSAFSLYEDSEATTSGAIQYGLPVNAEESPESGTCQYGRKAVPMTVRRFGTVEVS